MSDDPTNLVQRVAVTKAALMEAGRPDLADRVVSAEELIAADIDAVSWRSFGRPPADDEIEMRRAAALASLSTGYDASDVFCESCIRAMNRPDCAKVTRAEFLAHKSCEVAA